MTGGTERLKADGAAFCIAHRLRYDPQLNVGCVLCQRAFARPEPSAAPPQGLLLAALLGVLAGMLGAVALEASPLRGTPARARYEPAPLTGLGLPPPRAQASEQQ